MEQWAMDSSTQPYDAIAEWYDAHVGGPIYEEIIVPGLLELAGNVRGVHVLDLACGQGIIARAFARQGAQVTGVDLSSNLLALAQRHEEAEPLGIVYIRDDAQSLNTLSAVQFDGVVCSMALMDIPNVPAALRASRCVLSPGGWMVIAMTHPCFEVPNGRWVTREDGTVAREVTRYFSEGFWRSSNPAGVRGQVGAYHRMLSTYLNTFAEAGYCVERTIESRATGQRATQVPGNREVPSFMLLRLRALAEHRCRYS
jgi:ubiquinone/menaquinone biosynthesis C-methylase UbiE